MRLTYETGEASSNGQVEYFLGLYPIQCHWLQRERKVCRNQKLSYSLLEARMVFESPEPWTKAGAHSADAPRLAPD